MSFRPSLHGWPFASVAAVDAHVLGLGATPAAEFGLDGGLCWTALDRYLRGLGIPRSTPRPEPGDALHSELVRRQVEALSGVWGRVREWQDRPDSSWRDRVPVRLSGGRDLGSRTRGEWRGIRRRLDRGEPVLLTLLFPADRYRRGRSARQVLATAWVRDEGRVVLSIYDPQRPDDDRIRLSFSRAGSLDARLGQATPVRAFFAVPYDRVIPAPARAESFGDRSVLGLNRPVRGRPAPVGGRRALDLVARNAEGALLHFRRRKGRSWEGANITDQQELGSFELHSDPVAVRSAALHVFSRSYVGDLLHFRLGRGWKVQNRTDHKKVGPRFRLAGTPVPTAGPWGRISVLGVDKDGGLVHYSGSRLTGWHAEQVAGQPLTGDPVAAWAGPTLHVAGRGAGGQLLHWERTGDRWLATELSALGGGAPEGLAGRPVLSVVDGPGVHLAGRTRAGRIAIMRKTGEEPWAGAEVGHDVVGDPVFTRGPAGTHLFARTRDGGLLHAWRDPASPADDDWQLEDVLASRPALSGLPSPAGLACWGSLDELRVWVRGGRSLWTLVWRDDADWVMERLADRAGVAERHRPGDDPVVLEDQAGLPHLFFTDGRGTVLHVEPASWQEPGDDTSTAPASRPAPDLASAAAASTEAPETPADFHAPTASAGETEPEDEVEWIDAMETAEPVEPAGPVETAEPVKPPTAPSGKPRKPAVPDLPYLDFEADPPRRKPTSEGTPGKSAPNPGSNGKAGAEKPAEATGSVAKKIEPMDLSLLDSWPPEPKSRQKRNRKGRGRESP